MCKEIGRKVNDNGRIVNVPSEQGKCLCCNNAKQARDTRTNKDGEATYKPYCGYCLDFKNGYTRGRFRGSKNYRKAVKETCDKCGFIPQHICQLDVDHIDNNHENNEECNLQTLCANCHRLKTQEHKDKKKNTRKKLVEDYFKEKEEYEATLPRLKKFRKGVDYMQYKIYLPENSTKEEINKAFEEYIPKFKARIGQEEYKRRQDVFKNRLSKI